MSATNFADLSALATHLRQELEIKKFILLFIIDKYTIQVNLFIQLKFICTEFYFHNQLLDCLSSN